MTDARGGRSRRARAVLLALALPVALALALLPPWARPWLDPALDRMLVALPAPSGALPWPLVVVEIGALDEGGAPWTRAASARLAEELGRAGPRVVGWDIVFAGRCDSPETAHLARGLAAVPSVLGMLMQRSPTPPAVTTPAPWGVAAPLIPALWAAPGAEVPCPALAAPGGAHAPTLASVALGADATARVRSVPAAVVAGGRLWPGLAPEVLRRALGVDLALLAQDGAGPLLRLGPRAVRLTPDGGIRLRPSNPRVWAGRRVAAVDVLTGTLPPDRLAGAVVLVGNVSPQAGGLRPTAASPLHPSVHLAADALTGLALGRVPHRPLWAPWAEGGGLALMALVLAALMARLPATGALAVALALGLVWAAGAAAALGQADLLLDPVAPPVALGLAAGLALAVQAAASQRAERALRRRMGQLMPPEIVARLAGNPDLLRLRGEAREVTALFTDLEGFSGLVNRLPPEAVIALLERYFARIVAAVLAEGGMIDKIVGDGVHALFNAPLDRPDHAAAALRAARAILAATEALRGDLPDLGRTRIGIETGRAVLGDVGAGERIDYTAHGPAVNLAARLQDAARDLAVPVVVGPGCAAQVQGAGLRGLGSHTVRSFGVMDLHTLA
jgi:adenylate cyclase